MVVDNNPVKLLASLGLTEYEARAYTALITAQPASAYGLAKRAGMPTSKIYQTLAQLEEKGLAIPMAGEKERGRKFAACDPDEYLAAKKQNMAQTAAMLAPLLRDLAPAGEIGHVWPIASSEAVIARARRMLGKATERVLVSLWPEEFENLQKALGSVVERGVKVAVVHFGKPRVSIGATFHHPVERAIYREKGGRGLTLVVDGAEAMMATFMESGQVEGAWSRNRAFVSATEDYIRHDVYITKVTAVMGNQMRRKFGDNYEKLRDVFLAAEEV
ncbi:MAG: hypothetical protein OEZ04_02460 [Nitrospinota bacterium]|nr:hypothetical protein [Nitrospinota bacterium]